MGDMNFNNFEDTPQAEGSGGKPAAGNNFPLARQSSIFALTFDELQNTRSGLGKDFGSINMEDLLKNIWAAEETQAMESSTGAGEGSIIPGGNLQRQGSLTLPRTLSQKTVDEVWRDVLKESGGLNDGSDTGGTNMPQREPTLGEITLEEFLVRAGVVIEDIQPTARPDNGGFYSEMPRSNNNNTGFTLGFQQPAHNHAAMANQIGENNNNNVVQNLSPNMGLNVGGVGASQPRSQQQSQPLAQPPFSKQQTLAFASPMHLVNNCQLPNQGTKGPIFGRSDTSTNTGLVQGGVIQNGAMGMASLVTGATTAAGGSPVNQLSPHLIANGKHNLDASSLSPSPYAFSEGLRGRKSNNFEKVVERRHRRMIKNRESAARSRSRKQAYTLELEAEIAKLKELNQELQNNQEKYAEMQKTQVMEMGSSPWGSKRCCLRRTLTGPW